MAGFLDKQSHIVDLVLTAEGRAQLTAGQLEFVYWVAFDDEVDYDPVLMESGSYSDPNDLVAEKTRQTEDSLVIEAVTGYKYAQNLLGYDLVNLKHPLFTIPQGQDKIPSMQVAETGSITLRVGARAIEDVFVSSNGEQIGDAVQRGIFLHDPTAVRVELGYGGVPVPPNADGFLVQVFESGSHGLVETPVHADKVGRVAFGREIVLG